MTGYKDYGFINNQPAHSFDYLQAPLLSLLSKKRNQCILDLGCGNGYLVNYLIAQGFNAFGTDASEKGIAIARETNPARFFVQDLSTSKLPDGLKNLNFDTIISTEVIEHLFDPEGFIGFCKKTLNGKGELVISTPYHGFLKNLGISIFNKWDAHFSPEWYGGHIKFWSKASLSHLLCKSGFTITDFKGCGRVPYFWKSMIIKAKID
ncbi:MAG: class SAM-dependent methyltransferase [Mucilaginibacter sp.]|nr:class SAM-dependent methyltransferase [Mucilaginibacter sp.]